MAEFEELKEQRLNFKTMDSWATMIAKAIIKESNYRRAMKQIVKQISIASQREEHMRIKDNKFHDDPEKKIGQFKMRLKLWEYYWIGTREILRLSNEFSALNARFERNKLPPKAMAAKVNAEDKIHKYIYFLERNIDQNVQNIQYIEKTARSMGYDLVLL